MAGSPLSRIYPVALFAAAYFAGSELGYALSLGPSVGGTFWPPAGISLAAFLVAPRRLWPALLLAGIAANWVSDLLHGQTLPASVGFAVANLGEPILGALLLHRILPAPITFTRLQEIVALAVVVGLVAAPWGAAIGAGTAQWFTQNPPGFPAGWRTWWIGDAVGAVVLTPCALRIATNWRRAPALPPHVWLEAAAFFLVAWVVTDVIFSAPPTSLALPFLVFPVLAWGSLRLGPVAVGGALCLIVLLTTHDTANGHGPFAGEHLSFGDRLIALQTYVGVMGISFHGLAVLWEERARTAAALRQAHSGLAARHRRIVEQSPLAILAIRPGGDVQEVNPAWQRLWHATTNLSEPGTGARWWQDPQLAPLLDRAFTGEVVELPELELVVSDASDTSLRRVRGFAYPVKDEAGSVAEVVLIEQDVTEEVQAQQQREQLLDAERAARSEAERASQLKDQFLATLSHELRTPLNAIVGWAHILRRTANEPRLAHAVETIERNARAQAKLIDDLLDMSRIMAGKVGLTLAPAPLADLVVGAVDALRPTADAKGVHLVLDVEHAAHAWIACDAARLQQVVTNILGNGIKFTPGGGRVEIEATVDGHEARIVVRDTGQGISAEFLPAVFERFRQADGSSTRRHGGLGLGLSIAKQIVEMHGGTIAAASDGMERGATFTVRLPLAKEAVAADAVDGNGSPSPALKDVRVLIVDDEADARDLLLRLLVEHGCVAAIAGSAEEAAGTLAAQPYDVLLTDIGMPGTDGYELLRRVRANGLPSLRAVAVTAFARPEDRARALAAGFDGHLAKPVDPVALIRLLSQLCMAPAVRGSEATVRTRDV